MCCFLRTKSINYSRDRSGNEEGRRGGLIIRRNMGEGLQRRTAEPEGEI